MFEKVNMYHPDKVADRIAGAFVDLAYKKQKDPKIAVEVLIGHGKATIIAETSVNFLIEDAEDIVKRIAGPSISVDFMQVPQDKHLARNQRKEIKCGDNGVFRGYPVTVEQRMLTSIVERLQQIYKSDGKLVITPYHITVCQSNCKTDAEIENIITTYYKQAELYPLDKQFVINPLGPWTGGTDVDCGATNRKLGSDMGDAVTGGGLHGKDLSKADVTLNIYCHLLAQHLGKPVETYCSIGDSYVLVGGNKLIRFADAVEVARKYIKNIGGFEKFAEYGLIR